MGKKYGIYPESITRVIPKFLTTIKSVNLRICFVHDCFDCYTSLQCLLYVSFTSIICGWISFLIMSHLGFWVAWFSNFSGGRGVGGCVGDLVVFK